MGKAVVGTDVGRGVGGIVVGETIVGETVLGAKVVGKGNGETDGGAVVRLDLRGYVTSCYVARLLLILNNNLRWEWVGRLLA